MLMRQARAAIGKGQLTKACYLSSAGRLLGDEWKHDEELYEASRYARAPTLPDGPLNFKGMHSQRVAHIHASTMVADIEHGLDAR